MDYRADLHKNAVILFQDDEESLWFYDMFFKIVDAVGIKNKIQGVTITNSLSKRVIGTCSRMSIYKETPVLTLNRSSGKLKRTSKTIIRRNKRGSSEISFDESFVVEQYQQHNKFRDEKLPFLISSCELTILHELAHIKHMSHKKKFHLVYKNMLIKWIQYHLDFKNLSKLEICSSYRELIDVIYDSKKFYYKK